MELAEKRYAQWLAQQGLEPELRQELDAMHSDAEKVTDAFYRDLEFGTGGSARRARRRHESDEYLRDPPRDAGGCTVSQRDGAAEDRRHWP